MRPERKLSRASLDAPFSPGDADYGIVSFLYDPAGKLLRKTDQTGATITHTDSFAGWLASRAHRTLADSLSGTIADEDTFTYDPAGRFLIATKGRYGNTVTFTYDDANLDHAWDLSLVGNRTEYTTNNVPQSRTHGPAHELTAIGMTSLSYDSKGKLTIHRGTHEIGGNCVEISSEEASKPRE